MALSPNYGFPEPDNSSLVKNGAQDIRALGDAIDTSVWNVGYGQAAKNKILNSDFSIWQRGTSFLNPAIPAYTADRWFLDCNGSGATRTLSQQTFTPGTAPVAGYEGTYFFRYARTVAGTGATFDNIRQRIEDVRTFAGQTATLSFWAKVDSGTPTLTLRLTQSFGSGGSANVSATDVTVTLSSTWTRYTATFAIPSVSGKTIGAGSYLQLDLRLPVNTVLTTDFWGVQLEYGSKATPFQTATGTIQGELAACQRYYWFIAGGASGLALSNMCYFAATDARGVIQFPQTMRTSPTQISASGVDYFAFEVNGANDTLNFLGAVRINPQAAVLFNQTNVSGTAGQAGYLVTNNSLASLAFSAEL